MNINIESVESGVSTALYPEHIFEWKVSGVNCPTEDYTVGNVSTPILTFRTDVNIGLSAEIRTQATSNVWLKWKITDKVKNANSIGEAVSYTITAITKLPYDLDDVVPESIYENFSESSSLTDVWEEVVGLMNYETGSSSGITVMPRDCVNENYIVGNKWCSSGLTYR